MESNKKITNALHLTRYIAILLLSFLFTIKCVHGIWLFIQQMLSNHIDGINNLSRFSHLHTNCFCSTIKYRNETLLMIFAVKLIILHRSNAYK